jgi:hypothetical protein
MFALSRKGFEQPRDMHKGGSDTQPWRCLRTLDQLSVINLEA